MMAISAAAGPSSAARLGRCSWSGLACARAPLHLCPLCHGAPTRWAAVLLLLLLLADGLVQAAPSPAAAANSTYVGYAAICVVGKNENRYIREWVDYHKCLGGLHRPNTTTPTRACVGCSPAHDGLRRGGRSKQAGWQARMHACKHARKKRQQYTSRQGMHAHAGRHDIRCTHVHMAL